MPDADDPTSAAADLRVYLAERDVPCPACGYNLRGVQEAVCPECGSVLSSIQDLESRPGLDRRVDRLDMVVGSIVTLDGFAGAVAILLLLAGIADSFDAGIWFLISGFGMFLAAAISAIVALRLQRMARRKLPLEVPYGRLLVLSVLGPLSFFLAIAWIGAGLQPPTGF